LSRSTNQERRAASVAVLRQCAGSRQMLDGEPYQTSAAARPGYCSQDEHLKPPIVPRNRSRPHAVRLTKVPAERLDKVRRASA
jgi:hypothetical protein